MRNLRYGHTDIHRYTDVITYTIGELIENKLAGCFKVACFCATFWLFKPQPSQGVCMPRFCDATRGGVVPFGRQSPGHGGSWQATWRGEFHHRVKIRSVCVKTPGGFAYFTAACGT